MKIITCCKLVTDEQDIVIRQDRSVDISSAGAKISQMDLNAIEAARLLLASDQDTVIALSVGGCLLSQSKLRKDLLSRGPNALYLVQGERLEQLTSKETAQALALAVSKIGYDLILFGEGSDDAYAQQVGLLVGEILRLPAVNAVSGMTLDGDSVLVQRTLENEIEELRLPLPAVLTVTSESNVPTLPTMKAILAAGKKPVVVWNEADIGWSPPPVSDIETVNVRALAQADRKRILFEEPLPDAVAAIAEHLCKSLDLSPDRS
ncbi:electron transfer flavoprotein [Salmonella enterica]|nr:electron transfer flavoprotein [Salmonella enterica]EMD7797585.1 putative electron transfer flavoprotein FixA [Salmonella enterica]